MNRVLPVAQPQGNKIAKNIYTYREEPCLQEAKSCLVVLLTRESKAIATANTTSAELEDSYVVSESQKNSNHIVLHAIACGHFAHLCWRADGR